MTRILIAAIALSFSVGAADAATKHKRKHVRHHAPVAAYVPASPYAGLPEPPALGRAAAVLHRRRLRPLPPVRRRPDDALISRAAGRAAPSRG